MSKQKQGLLKQYKKDVDTVRICANNLGLSDKEIEQIFKRCFVDLRKNTCSSMPIKQRTKAQYRICTARNVFVLFMILAIFIYILLNVHQPTTSFVLRNVQYLTYPTLKIIRYLSVPIIKIFPSLTDLYDETCLVENPYFYVADMECWPGENVQSVLDMTGTNAENAFNSGSGVPFIVKTQQKLVTAQELQQMYKENKKILDLEARRVKSTNLSISILQDVFEHELRYLTSSKTHISWRVNKMLPASVIRRLFPRPSFIHSRSGQSVERFVLIDGSEAEPYILPNTECSYVHLIQGSGERIIVLRPSKECIKHCRTISVLLKPSYVLWYNWWYWRPISLPTENSTDPSISYINSHC